MKELNALELNILQLFGFSVFIDPVKYTKYNIELKNFAIQAEIQKLQIQTQHFNGIRQVPSPQFDVAYFPPPVAQNYHWTSMNPPMCNTPGQVKSEAVFNPQLGIIYGYPQHVQYPPSNPAGLALVDVRDGTKMLTASNQSYVERHSPVAIARFPSPDYRHLVANGLNHTHDIVNANNYYKDKSQHGQFQTPMTYHIVNSQRTYQPMFGTNSNMLDYTDLNWSVDSMESLRSMRSECPDQHFFHRSPLRTD